MAFSKSTRIIILLVIDSAFFLLELITGYYVHSLALIADAFHMLNDVLSLFVGLWAVKVANSRSNEKTYTYGWQRAETLGALFNGVFLVALCVSIFLEAIQRFVEPQVVTQPKLILIVGCMGLTSNLLGLLLFHEHGHSHGGHDHGARDAEEGHSHGAGHSHAVESGPTATPSKQARRHSRSYSTAEAIPEHPSEIRRSIIDAGRADVAINEDDEDDTHTHDTSALLGQNGHSHYGATKRKSFDHSQHVHRQPKEAKSGGHSHADLNMRGVFLHVLGDALGNVGVIGTALFIWLTDFSWRYYADPAISLIITAIILTSALPLCKAASRILLQAVPAGINIDEIKMDIESLPGIYSCHHLHVWQLSDTKLIASLHIRVAMDFKNEDAGRYMELARGVRKCLHEYGIHSVTIQPEFCLDEQHNHSVASTAHDEHDHATAGTSSKAGSICEQQTCLLECDDNCGPSKSCCGPAKTDEEDHDHDHAGHDHSH